MIAYLGEGPQINANAVTRGRAVSVLRNVCARTIKENPDEWPEWKIGTTVEEYTKYLLDPESWGGEIEVTLHNNNAG